MNEIVFVISSRHNRLGKPVRQAVDPTEQMATPALFHSKYKLLSGRDGERVVTQESHPGSWETSQDGPRCTGKVLTSTLYNCSKIKVKSAYDPSGPSVGALVAVFCNMKRLGAFLLPPGWDASPSQGYPPISISTPEGREVLEKWSILSKNTTQCSRPGFEPGAQRANHEAAAPPCNWIKTSSFVKSQTSTLFCQMSQYGLIIVRFLCRPVADQMFQSTSVSSIHRLLVWRLSPALQRKTPAKRRKNGFVKNLI